MVSEHAERTLYWDGYDAVEEVYVRYNPAMRCHEARTRFMGQKMRFSWFSDDPEEVRQGQWRTYEEAFAVVRKRIVRDIADRTQALTTLEAAAAARRRSTDTDPAT